MRRSQRGAMRGVFLFLGLAAVAVFLALLMGHNEAMITVFWPPYRLDASFNFVLLLLLGAVVLVHLALRALSILRDMPAQARRWRRQQVERAAVGSVLDALSHQLAGRFVRAQAAAIQALEQLNGLPSAQWARRNQLQMLAHLLAAESAQSLRNRASRDAHLASALHPHLVRSAPEAHEGALLRAARWAIEDRQPEEARARLSELPQGAARRIQALRLKLRVAQMSGEPGQALETARLLAKHRAFSADVASSVLKGLALDALREAHDHSQLLAVWSRLDTRERSMPDLILAAAARAWHFLTTDDVVDANDRQRTMLQILEWIEPLWPSTDQLDDAQQRQLIAVLEPGLEDLDASWLARVEQVQRQAPGNPNWQYLAGQAFLKRQLWGKAGQLLGQATHGLKDARLLRRAWCSLARLAQERGDEAAANQAWRRAALLD